MVDNIKMIVICSICAITSLSEHRRLVLILLMLATIEAIVTESMHICKAMRLVHVSIISICRIVCIDIMGILSILVLLVHILDAHLNVFWVSTWIWLLSQVVHLFVVSLVRVDFVDCSESTILILLHMSTLQRARSIISSTFILMLSPIEIVRCNRKFLNIITLNLIIALLLILDLQSFLSRTCIIMICLIWTINFVVFLLMRSKTVISTLIVEDLWFVVLWEYVKLILLLLLINFTIVFSHCRFFLDYSLILMLVETVTIRSSCISHYHFTLLFVDGIAHCVVWFCWKFWAWKDLATSVVISWLNSMLRNYLLRRVTNNPRFLLIDRFESIKSLITLRILTLKLPQFRKLAWWIILRWNCILALSILFLLLFRFGSRYNIAGWSNEFIRIIWMNNTTLLNNKAFYRFISTWTVAHAIHVWWAFSAWDESIHTFIFLLNLIKLLIFEEVLLLLKLKESIKFSLTFLACICCSFCLNHIIVFVISLDTFLLDILLIRPPWWRWFKFSVMSNDKVSSFRRLLISIFHRNGWIVSTLALVLFWFTLVRVTQRLDALKVAALLLADVLLLVVDAFNETWLETFTVLVVSIYTVFTILSKWFIFETRICIGVGCIGGDQVHSICFGSWLNLS